MECSLFLLLLFVWFSVASGETDSQDAAAIRSLKDSLENLPLSWFKSDDPCGDKWEGVNCTDSKITSLRLSTMGLKGTLSGDIGGLSALRILDLSYNGGLTGPLTPSIGSLKSLNILILVGCTFTGKLPQELGDLPELTYMALNSNNFTGEIPSSLGNLSNLYWLDLAENQITGNIPVSPGLNQLFKAKHFHLNKNQLSGTILPELFQPEMKLIHVLLDGNQLSGSIPSTLGLISSMEVLRLDRNSFSGPVPETISNLTSIHELNLGNNKLTGPIPDLSRMTILNYLDLSNNSFDSSPVPKWFSTLTSLTTLVMESSGLEGPLPPAILQFPQIQQVKLKNNELNGTLDIGEGFGDQLELIDLKFNNISGITVGAGSSNYKDTIQLYGNPVCSSNLPYCRQEQQLGRGYSTSITNCGSKPCPPDQELNPKSCDCAYAYEGTLYFRAPSFSELSNSTKFHALETDLWIKIGLPPGSVSLRNPFFNSDDYLEVRLELFPPSGKYFTRSDVQMIGFDLSNQTFKPPKEFGPYYFIASPYIFPPEKGKSSFSLAAIIGIAVAGTILVLVLIGVGVYACRQKRRAEKAKESGNPFASWGPSGKNNSGPPPQLKGARWFSYEELKKSTSNFSESYKIGSGGYGKVYKGILPDAQLVAIKRAQQGSMQGGTEFKTEIELLSRVHHKNLLGLVGFCFEQGEQLLVYEYMPNGTLRESLTGKSGIYLDWKRRLRIALGSARGIAYLHELAHPPIIHRDIKSTNILLDEYLTAKVADFGLSKLVSESGKSHISTQVKGTMGYLDPEYYMTQQLTEKSDVYSFGIVMLELITGKQPIDKGLYIVREVRKLMNKNDDQYGLNDIIDPAIKDIPNLFGFRKFLELAMQCVEDAAPNRPTMSETVKQLEIILQSEGVNTSFNSASSSATDFGTQKGQPRHPYNESPSKKESEGSGPFEYSGNYTMTAKVEPK